MRKRLLALTGAALLFASGAQAASFTFSVSVTGGTLDGNTYTGGFSFLDPAAGFTGETLLTAFDFGFPFAPTPPGYYGLGDDPGGPTAEFDNGNFLGIWYFEDTGLFSFTPADLFTPLPASFEYDFGGGDTGTGTPIFTPTGTPVPEPETWLVSLLAVSIGLLARKRRRGKGDFGSKVAG